jgi:hypothetical protein
MSCAQSAWVKGYVLPTIMCATTSLSPEDAGGAGDGAADAEEEAAVDVAEEDEAEGVKDAC